MGRLPSVWLGWWQTCLRSRYREMHPPAISRRMRETSSYSSFTRTRAAPQLACCGAVTLLASYLLLALDFARALSTVKSTLHTVRRSHAQCSRAPRSASRSRSRPPPRTRRSSSRSGHSRCSTLHFDPPTSPRYSAHVTTQLRPKPRSHSLQLTPRTRHKTLPLLPGQTYETFGFGCRASRRRERLGDVPHSELAASAYPLIREACERYG